MKRRNPTPREFAISVSILVSMLVGGAILVYSYFLNNQAIHWSIFIGILLVSFFVTYILLYQLLERFIYRKIKLIYKTIHDYKLGKTDINTNKVDLNSDIIDEVNDEVQRWALRKNQEISRLKELENYRKDFLGNVFHEIKTPVFSVQGYLHTLLDGAIDDATVNKNYIQKAAKNIDRLEKIIEDLELITLKENNKMILEYTTFDITRLIKDVFDALELQADEKDIEFGFKEGCDLPTKVYADYDKIRQVVVNLVNNAIKYGKEGGNVTIGIYNMDHNFLIEITDDGIGIEAEKLNRLFERFYRVDESRYRGKDKIGGSGLGLSISKHIIDAHNQTLSVRSTVNIGTTFGFTLQNAKNK